MCKMMNIEKSLPSNLVSITKQLSNSTQGLNGNMSCVPDLNTIMDNRIPPIDRLNMKPSSMPRHDLVTRNYIVRIPNTGMETQSVVRYREDNRSLSTHTITVMEKERVISIEQALITFTFDNDTFTTFKTVETVETIET